MGFEGAAESRAAGQETDMDGSRREKLNNKGFSLVEVLVGVIILGVVVGPLLSVFVASARYDARSKEQQLITGVAESLMESFKAYNTEELEDKFALPGTPGILNAADGAVTDGPGGSRVFTLKGMEINGSDYDAKIIIKPSNEKAAGETNPSWSNVTLFGQNGMNAYRDAVWCAANQDNYTEYETVIDDIVATLNSSDPDHVYDRSSLDRSKFSISKRTNITIYTDMFGAGKVWVSRTYSYSGWYEVEEYNEWWRTVNTVTRTYSGSRSFPAYGGELIYDNTASRSFGATLDNVYLFYYPAYSSGLYPAPVDSDTINVSYTAAYPSEPVNIVLLKQSAGLSNEITMENTYRPTVVLNGNLNLRHNLNENLGGGGTVGSYTISGIASSRVSTGLTEKVTGKNLLYDVEIGVYKSGEYDSGFTGDILYTLTGSMN